MTELTAPAPVVPRDKVTGRPLVKDPGNGKLVSYRRVTTFIKVLEDEYLLNRWRQRCVAVGMAERDDLVLKAAAAAGERDSKGELTQAAKKELDEVCDIASEIGRATQAARVGSAVHALTHQLDRGVTPLVPPSAREDIEAYKRGTRHLGMLEVEVFVVHDPYKVGGTFDRIVELDGRQYVADIKTGDIYFSARSIEMQLAMYADSEHYDPTTGRREPLDVDRDWGIVIHVPAMTGTCELKWANLEAGRRDCALALQVWASRQREALTGAGPQGLDLLRLIGQAPDRTALEALWAFHNNTWTDTHTQAARARIAALNGTQTPSPATAG